MATSLTAEQHARIQSQLEQARQRRIATLNRQQQQPQQQPQRQPQTSHYWAAAPGAAARGDSAKVSGTAPAHHPGAQRPQQQQQQYRSTARHTPATYTTRPFVPPRVREPLEELQPLHEPQQLTARGAAQPTVGQSHGQPPARPPPPAPPQQMHPTPAGPPRTTTGHSGSVFQTAAFRHSSGPSRSPQLPAVTPRSHPTCLPLFRPSPFLSPAVRSPANECLPENVHALGEECTICNDITLEGALDGHCGGDGGEEEGGLGSLDCCDHLFCHSCILKWVTECSNTCPLCKRTAHKLIRRRRRPNASGCGPRLVIDADEQILEEHEARGRLDELSAAELERLAAEEDANGNCTECGGGHDEELILLCDSCNSGYHTYCVGLNSVPAGDWYCPVCAVVHLPEPAVTANETARPVSAAHVRPTAAARSHGQRRTRDIEEEDKEEDSSDGSDEDGDDDTEEDSEEEEEEEEDDDDDMDAFVAPPQPQRRQPQGDGWRLSASARRRQGGSDSHVRRTNANRGNGNRSGVGQQPRGDVSATSAATSACVSQYFPPPATGQAPAAGLQSLHSFYQPAGPASGGGRGGASRVEVDLCDDEPSKGSVAARKAEKRTVKQRTEKSAPKAKRPRRVVQDSSTDEDEDDFD